MMIWERARLVKSVRDGEQGAEMVEFALVLAMLMMLMLGIVVFARAYDVYQTITRAAREGVRMAVLPSSAYDGNTTIDGTTSYSSPTSPIFTNYIKPALLAANLNPDACTSQSQAGCISNYSESVRPLNPGEAYEQCGVTIGFTYPFQLNVPFTTLGLTTIDLHTSVQMRLEDQPTTGTCP